MPHSTTAPPSQRFFARLSKFDCECPSCGQLIFSAMDGRADTYRRQALTRKAAKQLSERSRRRFESVWNPVTQRLLCPHCGKAYMAGLLLFPAPTGRTAVIDPPPDVVPTVRELAVIRQRAGGFWASGKYQRKGHVNVAVVSACTCPDRGWEKTCPVHAIVYDGPEPA